MDCSLWSYQDTMTSRSSWKLHTGISNNKSKLHSGEYVLLYFIIWYPGTPSPLYRAINIQAYRDMSEDIRYLKQEMRKMVQEAESLKRGDAEIMQVFLSFAKSSFFIKVLRSHSLITMLCVSSLYQVDHVKNYRTGRYVSFSNQLLRHAKCYSSTLRTHNFFLCNS